MARSWTCRRSSTKSAASPPDSFPPPGVDALARPKRHQCCVSVPPDGGIEGALPWRIASPGHGAEALVEEVDPPWPGVSACDGRVSCVAPKGHEPSGDPTGLAPACRWQMREIDIVAGAVVRKMLDPIRMAMCSETLHGPLRHEGRGPHRILTTGDQQDGASYLVDWDRRPLLGRPVAQRIDERRRGGQWDIGRRRRLRRRRTRTPQDRNRLTTQRPGG